MCRRTPAEAEHARGVLAERERLAAEIHDTLAQGFTSIVALCQATDGVLATDPPAARDRLAMIERTARENLAEARALVAALGPVDLDHTTLPDRVSGEVGVPVEVVVEGAPHPLPADREVVLLRAVQEALADVRKHAGASHVRLRLVYEGTGATVEVRDDGAVSTRTVPRGSACGAWDRGRRPWAAGSRSSRPPGVARSSR